MNTDLLSLLKKSRIFSSLDEEACRRILPKFTLVNLKKNECLFLQGEVSDSVYCVAQGSLSAALTTVGGDTRIIGVIEPGETVGELGALSNEPRSLTVAALQDSTVIKISAEDFLHLCHEYSSIMFAILHPIIARSKSMIHMLKAAKKSNHILIVPANNTFSIEPFARQLTSYNNTFRRLLIISDYDPLFKDKQEAVTSVNEKIRQLAQDKKTAHKFLFVVSSHDTPLAKVAFKIADAVYIAAYAHSTPHIDRHIIDKLESRHAHLKRKPSLVLIHLEETLVPQNTSEWLKQIDFFILHHVRLDMLKDIQRLMRFIRGKAVGVVLSGGGTRSWAHLGVIKALKASKIPIDFIGGTSGGAIIGALYAMHPSVDDIYERFYKLNAASAHSLSWRSLTWPSISIFNAKYYTRAIRDTFGGLRIEDLWLPYFCISTNMATTDEDLHTSGVLWEKIRASTSIPGIVPPMVINGEIHFDGGLLNNLPVNIMRGFVGNKAKIIAVDLNGYSPQFQKYDFPPVLTLKDTLLSKLGLGATKYKFPGFVDTFIAGLFVGSVLKSRQNSLNASIFINLSLGKYSLLHVNLSQAKELVQIGYEAALKQIYEAKNNPK